MAYTTLAFFLLFVLNWTTDKSDSNLASWNPFLYSSPNEFLIEIQNHRNSSVDNGQQTTDNSLCTQLGDFSLETVEEVVIEEEVCVEETETIETIEEEIAVAEEVVEISSEEVVAEVTPEILETSDPEALNSSDPQILKSSIPQFLNSSNPQILKSSDPETLNSSIPQILKSYFIIGGSFQTEASAEKCLNVIKKQGFENASTLDKNDKGYIRVYYESFADKAEAVVRLNEIKSQCNESAWLLFQK